LDALHKLHDMLLPRFIAIRALSNQLRYDETSQDLIEYAVIAALIGLGAVLTMTNLGTQIGSTFSSVSSNLNSAV
jgi:pilus assembly protein Flp/PilA